MITVHVSVRDSLSYVGWHLHAMINLHTRYEVSTFTHYEDMKTTQNAELWAVSGHPRSPAMPPFDRADTISYSTLIVIMRLPFSSYLSKVAHFNLRTCIWCPR